MKVEALLDNKTVLMILLSKYKYQNDSRVIREINTLTQNNYNVILLVLENGTNNIREEINENSYSYKTILKTRKLPKNQLFWWIKYIEWIFKIVKFAKNNHFDSIHCHDLKTLIPGYILKKRFHKPLVYDSHELYLDQQLPRLQKIFWTLTESSLIKKADLIFSENQSRAQRMEQNYQMDGIIALNNMQEYKPYTRTNRLRDELKLGDEKIILYQGLISKARGLDTLLEVALQLKKHRFIIMGDGPFKDELRKQILDKNIDNIIVLDAVPMKILPEYTSSADLGISILKNINLNHYYALSNKIFEYLSAGLPIVFSDFPEMRRIINNYEVGQVVDESNVSKIIDAIERILEDPIKYKQCHENALNSVKHHLNWENESKKLIDNYRNIHS